jgi:hypothetical protein
MQRRLLASILAVALPLSALAAASLAGAAAPTGFTPPQTVGAGLDVFEVAAADAAGGAPAAVAFADRNGGVWAARVRADGSLGSPMPAASGQRAVRGVQAAVTDRGELVVVWTGLLDRSGRSAVRYAVAEPGRSFSGAKTLASVGTYTGATQQIAALRGGTVAVIFRDTDPSSRSGVLRYARRPPHGTFGPARSLGHDGVAPAIQATPNGGAVLAWMRGPLPRRALEVITARSGAALPSAAAKSVAGRVRSVSLTSSGGTVWVTWTTRPAGGPAAGGARQVRAGNAPAVGPVQSLGPVAYGSPHVALDQAGDVLAALNAQGPGVQPNVQLASAQGHGAALRAPVRFDAGGFSQTSPIPAWHGATPLVLLTRQIPAPNGAPAEVAAADPATGDATVLGPAGTNGAPAVAHGGATLVVAWAARGGGVAVSVAR